MESRRPSAAPLVILLVATLFLGGCSVRTGPEAGDGADASTEGADAEIPAVPADIGEALAYQDEVASAVAGVEFPETNPFTYQNPWR